MKKLLYVLILLGLTFYLNGCSKEDNSINTASPILTDISISTSVNFINWVDSSDLIQKLENVLSYNYGLASETQIDKQQSFNTDTTVVVASVDFKTAFQNTYNDTNPSNNAVTITLEKNEGVQLIADGPGNTYNLITSVLAPGYNPIEAPDCSHTAFESILMKFLTTI